MSVQAEPVTTAVEVTPSTSEAAPQEATPVTTEAAPTDATPPVESEPAAEPVFATVNGVSYKDDYDLFESSPELAPLRDRLVRDTVEDEQRKSQTKFESYAASEDAKRVLDTVQGHLGRLAQKVDEGDLEGAHRIWDSFLAYAERFDPAWQGRFVEQGRGQEAGALYNQMRTFLPDRRSQDEFNDYAKSAFANDGKNAWDGIMKKFVSTIEKRAADGAYERGVKDTKAAQTANAQAEANNGQGPDNTRASAGSSISTLAEAERRYNLPYGHPDRISHEDFKGYRTQFGVK